MESIDEILEHYDEYKSPIKDYFGLHFCSFLTLEQAHNLGFCIKKELKDKYVPKKWTKENVEDKLKQSIIFGWKQVCKENYGDAYIARNTIKSWCKVLEKPRYYLYDFLDEESFFEMMARECHIKL